MVLATEQLLAHVLKQSGVVEILIVGGCKLSTSHHNMFHCEVFPIPITFL